MANICWYQVKVKGDKKNIMFLYHSMPVYNYIELIDSSDDTIIFIGDCKWSLDAYCENSNADIKIDVDKYISDIDTKLINDPTEYIYYTLKDKSKILNCEIEVFSEYEDYDIDNDEGDRPLYQHFSKGNTLEEEEMSFKEIQKRANKAFNIDDAIPNYYKEEDVDFSTEYKKDYEIFPWEEELVNTQLNGGIERAENYKINDPVKLTYEVENEYDDSAVRVDHELGFVGYAMYNNYAIIDTLEETNGEEPHARITEVIPLSKRGSRCKKPIVKIEVYLENKEKLSEKKEIYKTKTNEQNEIVLWACWDNVIKEMIIPDNIDIIGEGYGCHLDCLLRVIIPQNVKKIENNCFIDSFNLQEVIFEGNPEIMDNVFGSDYENITIKCKKNSDNVIRFAEKRGIKYIIDNE